MARPAVASEPLERGEISFLYRPHDAELSGRDPDPVQRLFLRIEPTCSPYHRLIAVAREKQLSAGARHRFWGFVDLVLTPSDLDRALEAQVYGTRTAEVRQLPAAHTFAQGDYSIDIHDGQAHLRWRVHRIDLFDGVARALELERSGDYLVHVGNPDPAAWGLDEMPDLQGALFEELDVHVTLPSPFPLSLHRRFRGRRSLPLDATTWLDHPGAELFFTASC
jgi:hypothetical protein